MNEVVSEADDLCVVVFLVDDSDLLVRAVPWTRMAEADALMASTNVRPLPTAAARAAWVSWVMRAVAARFHPLPSSPRIDSPAREVRVPGHRLWRAAEGTPRHIRGPGPSSLALKTRGSKPARASATPMQPCGLASSLAAVRLWSFLPTVFGHCLPRIPPVRVCSG